MRNEQSQHFELDLADFVRNGQDNNNKFLTKAAKFQCKMLFISHKLSISV